jgi:hypothetical protein
VQRDDAVLALAFAPGRPAETWSIDDYADVARCLGRAQVLYAPPAPVHPWMSQGFLRDYSTEKPVDWSLLNSDAAWEQPLVAACFPEELRDAVNEVHAKRDSLYTLAESLPRTLCHLDFWTKNLIRRDDGEFVLLDWAFVGDGAIGEDIGNLIPDAAFDHFITAAQLPELRTAVLTAYVDGMAQAGWTGDPDAARRGMAASAVKYDWLTPLMLSRAGATAHKKYGGTDDVDAEFLYRERGTALLDNARTALSALT